MKTRKTKEFETFTILRDACIKMAQLDLRLAGEKAPTEYQSRFLQLDEYAEVPSVTIETPILKGKPALVPTDQEVEVSFIHGGQPHQFVTLVLQHGEINLDKRKPIPSLELIAPGEISIEEKRSFYRVYPDEERPIKIKLAILADEEGQVDRIRSREKGILTSIAGEGLGFRIPEGKSLLLHAGTRVQIKFRLHPEDDELRLVAKICFRLRKPKGREVFFGVQFIDIDSDIAYKRSVDRILRFVAEEQRRYLAERTHLNQ